MKVDGAYAAVKFPSASIGKNEKEEETCNLLQDCRLMRKDELQVLSISI